VRACVHVRACALRYRKAQTISMSESLSPSSSWSPPARPDDLTKMATSRGGRPFCAMSSFFSDISNVSASPLNVGRSFLFSAKHRRVYLQPVEQRGREKHVVSVSSEMMRRRRRWRSHVAEKGTDVVSIRPLLRRQHLRIEMSVVPRVGKPRIL
jgi:hypothetical protein